MNRLDSDVKTELKIEKLINTDKVAMIASDAIFKKYKKHECKVCILFIYHNQDVHVRVHMLPYPCPQSNNLHQPKTP